MRFCLLFCFIIFAFLSFGSTYAQTSTAKEQSKPYTVEYYYKARWGFQNEFIQLFKKNHYPVLKKEMELGRILQVTATTPVPFHRRWTLGLSHYNCLEEFDDAE